MAYLSNAESWLATLGDEEVRGIARRIDDDGMYCVEDFLSGDDLQRMRGFVAAVIERGGRQSVSLGNGEMAGSGLEDLAASARFKALFATLYRVSQRRPAPEVDFYQVLRCLTGSSVSKHSFLFHYDSYVITALLPLQIPQTGRRGDFLIIPNTRRVRSHYLVNLVDKLLLDNRFAQRFLRRRADSLRRVSMVPGNLYLFWGYRSIHTNEPVDEAAVRATALYHYADPHAGSYLKHRLGRA